MTRDFGSIGAFAWVLLKGTEKVAEFSTVEYDTTNNRMEMKAILHGYHNFREKYGDLPLTIYTDSAYVVNCFKHGWWMTWQENGWINYSREPVKNRDLWEELIPIITEGNVTLKGVRGHSDNFWNNYTDMLARSASSREKLKKGRII